MEVHARRVERNPSPERLREYAAQMPNARETRFGNLNVQTQVTARSGGNTFVVSDEPEKHSAQTMPRSEYERLAKAQDDYLAEADMLVIDGYIGVAPFRTPTRMAIERSNANVAAMQEILFYRADGDDFEPELTTLYTPSLRAEGYPGDQVIVIDVENGLTRVLNSDYFGESKMGGLRMWNDWVFQRGGLAMHSGLKTIEVDGTDKVCLIVGLSGTGKTTTTFGRQPGARPVQDDFIALMPDGTVHVTENGCFAKTFGLDEVDEPVIYQAVTSPRAYLENVSQDETGNLDFFDTSYTENGRAVIRMQDIETAGDVQRLGKVDFLLILNRNENVIPAVAKLDGPKAVAYFMLGETKGTSAGGAAEAGKSLRVPGTNPFFPYLNELQGNRLHEIMARHEFDVYLLNTGRVGGPANDGRSKNVRIPHTTAIVDAIARGRIRWEADPDFGYLVASDVPGIEDLHLLQPRRLYESQGRTDEYGRLVDRLCAERAAYMAGFPGLIPEVATAL